MKQVDYLIVGQGIAGTLFAHELEKQGHDFMVIAPDSHNASKTAAGMYNPVVLKRFSPVWEGQSQIEQAKRTIAELEKKFNLTLDYPMDILRIFHDEDEKSTWQKKSNKPELKGLLEKSLIKNSVSHIVAPFELGKVNLGGKIDLNVLLTAFREYLERAGKLLNEALDYHRMTVNTKNCTYEGETDRIVAKKVVFCEGYGLKSNPFFSDLPLNGNKGEVLIVRIADLNLTAALKSKVFIMPMPQLGNDIYFVGATYHWTDKNDVPTEAAKKELLDKLSVFVKGDITVLSHRAGMRPTVIDRRPLLGRHREFDNLYVLNGLGTRGVMLGATMVRHLYQFIEEEKALPDEVNITRFAKPLMD